MLNIKDKEIYLACGHTDMRKSINGLSAIVQSSFKLNPCSKALFVFCNRKKDMLKILEWEDSGFWVHFKRLERGHFKWPVVVESEKTMVLSGEDLAYLLGSPGLEQKLKRKQTNHQVVI